MAVRFKLIVSDGNYTIETLSTGELHIGATGNLSGRLDSGDGRFHITDKAWRNWKPILEAYSDEIAVTDSTHSYDEDVLTDEQLVSYLQDIIKTHDSGGGGGDSVAWGDITGSLSNQSDLSTALAGKQPTLTAGTGISINNNVISATGGSGSSAWGDITGTLTDQTDLANALSGKQATLTFDNSPTENSTNPVKSGGVFTALAGKADASTARFMIHAEYNVGTGAVTLASGTTQAALMEALTAKKAMDIDFTVSGTYYRNPMLSFYEDGTGAHEVRFRNDAMGFDVVLKANTTSNTYTFEVEAFVMTESAYTALSTKNPNLIYFLTSDPNS